MENQQQTQFTNALLERIDRAQAQCGCRQVRLRGEVERFGGVKTAQTLAARGRVSEGFDQLAQAGRLDLSLEGLAMEPGFAPLFTDQEADWFLAQLVEGGYYKI